MILCVIHQIADKSEAEFRNMPYMLLALAIIAEVVGTMFLQRSEQFTRLVPSVLVVIAYASAFYLLSWTMKVIPVGIVYAVWSGGGIALIAAVGYFAFNQKLDLPAILGIGLILIGIFVILLYSKAAHH
jgi:small multidrug resistance pump